MIHNGKDVLLSQLAGSVPNVSDAMLDWFQPMTFTTIVKTTVNYQEIETLTDTTFLGVWQPFGPAQLLMKPEGQRAWKWFTVHAEVGLFLKPDEIVIYQGANYRVMQQLDYHQYGYYEYHILEDYQR